jgi:hypothetical protein
MPLSSKLRFASLTPAPIQCRTVAILWYDPVMAITVLPLNEMSVEEKLVNVDPNVVHENSSFPFSRSLRSRELLSCHLTPFASLMIDLPNENYAYSTRVRHLRRHIFIRGRASTIR